MTLHSPIDEFVDVYTDVKESVQIIEICISIVEVISGSETGINI
jgi:hypothetical protein